LSGFERKIQKIGVQNLKMPQFCLGTNVIFNLWSKIKTQQFWETYWKNGYFNLEIALSCKK
jgi:hypothetical protein